MNFLKLSAEPRDLLQRLRPPLALGPSYPPALSCLSPALPPSALNGPCSPESSVFLQLPLCLSDSPWAASRGHPGRPAPSPADGLPQGKEQLLARRPFPGLRVSGRSTAVASLSRRVSPDQHLPRVLRHEAPSVHWSPTRLHGQRPPLHVSKLKALGVLIPDPRASNTHSDPRPGALPCSPQPGVEARSGPALAQGRAGSSSACRDWPASSRLLGGATGPALLEGRDGPSFRSACLPASFEPQTFLARAVPGVLGRAWSSGLAAATCLRGLGEGPAQDRNGAAGDPGPGLGRAQDPQEPAPGCGRLLSPLPAGL
ncbi:uncharacterized protein [Sagmatias obliquidens]|uniref:uncharacterized protein isoform X1 n=1 Tax=Sagmatias obliquidens TaxID=3371155 RepID=UPI000F442C91|nr:uncharacterized protein LOC113630354 isoform X1 [Lagenorhynchus obliquidens]XP_026981384.1 uncharacterized protein LOC113630354 isoform X1 [Lagenorhynchus obliquidens]XP_026981385.1 uncharacterized protein LOC113630354 isoform X1 [Lagenorhynchus obliquidens]XP_026981386.1 uncharacterized protein LOC113630354 isoform X1 [Lagenorhynchus obliquidens]